MLAIEARIMGYRIVAFSPDSDTPTGQIADTEITSQYDDLDAVREFADQVDVITFEFENVPAKAVEAAAEFVQVYPNQEILRITQNRLREKKFLTGNGFPVTPFHRIRTIEDLYRGAKEIGVPGIVKTSGFGYDGKGQMKLDSDSDIEIVFEKLGENECVLEAFVDFEKEVSVVAARDSKGAFAHYGVIENDHSNHILDISFAPADVSEEIREKAIEITRGIAEKFEYIGTLCVEFFLTKDKKLLVNEIAPRPHNSGHLTFSSACATSQFEQQLRAICGLPLGSTKFFKPVAMANILGDLWENGEPDWSKTLACDNLDLHLYGKKEARAGRKMGHLTAIADSTRSAVDSVIRARKMLV